MGRRSSEPHSIYFNLRDALEQSGCAICTLATSAISKSLDDLLYERVNDPGIREELRDSGGFCHCHAWQLCSIGDSVGVGLLYQDLLERAIATIKQGVPGRARAARAHTASAVCPACRTMVDTADRYLNLFVEAFDASPLGPALERSNGLCLPHFSEALRRCRHRRPRATLMAWELEKLSALLGRLREFLRKHDYRYTAEGYRGDEAVSWLHAVEMFVGKPTHSPSGR